MNIFSYIAQSIISVVHAATSTIVINTSLPGASDIVERGPVGVIENAYQMALMLAGGLAFGVVVFAGVKYALSQGNSGAQSDARDRILQAFLGILLLIGAYILLNTVNPALTHLTLPTIGRLGIPDASQLPTDIWSKDYPIESDAPLVTGTGPGAASTTDAQAKAQLNSNIAVKPGVSLAGMQQSTINEVIALQEKCGCSFTVTSGTDGVHHAGLYSHATGYKFDLGLNSPALNSYIEKSGSFTNIGPRGGDNATQWRNNATGVVYAKEGNHWDVVVKPK